MDFEKLHELSEKKRGHQVEANAEAQAQQRKKTEEQQRRLTRLAELYKQHDEHIRHPFASLFAKARFQDKGAVNPDERYALTVVLDRSRDTMGDFRVLAEIKTVPHIKPGVETPGVIGATSASRDSLQYPDFASADSFTVDYVLRRSERPGVNNSELLEHERFVPPVDFRSDDSGERLDLSETLNDESLHALSEWLHRTVPKAKTTVDMIGTAAQDAHLNPGIAHNFANYQQAVSSALQG